MRVLMVESYVRLQARPIDYEVCRAKFDLILPYIELEFEIDITFSITINSSSNLGELKFEPYQAQINVKINSYICIYPFYL